MTQENKSELIQSLILLTLIIGLMIFLGFKGILAPILLGLLALNLVVLIHEGGHYLVAKMCGVGIQVFSIGMGPRLFGFHHKGIDYRISVLPLGGYVRMDGESLFEEALKNNDRSVLEKPGTLFGTTPWRRIAIAVAGAGFNILSAILFFFLAYLIGFSSPTDKAVAPLSYYYPEISSPASEAGFQAGDILLSANGNTLYSFQELAPILQKDKDGSVEIKVQRGEKEVVLTVIPETDEEGKKKAGLIWLLSNTISEITEDSPFYQIGIRKKDRILSINGIQTPQLSLYLLSTELMKKGNFTIEWRRNDEVFRSTLNLEEIGDQPLGIGFDPIRQKEGGNGFFPALAAGFTKPAQWIIDNFKGMYQIAVDPDKKLKDNAAGPIGITAGVGMTTLSAFDVSFANGISNFFQLVAVISSIIAIMNLLPIPALDGGMVLFTLIEMIRRKRFSPKTFYHYQFVGFIVIMGLAVLVLTMDISNIPKYF